MNRTETVLLCRYVKAMCPAQAIDEYTPDAWADVLYDVKLEDAKEAIHDGVREKGWRFIDITDVVSSVKAKRERRLLDWGRYWSFPRPPRALADDPVAENEWKRDIRDQIASGVITTPDDLPASDDGRPTAHEIAASVDHAAHAKEARAQLRSIPRPINPSEAVSPEHAAAMRRALTKIERQEGR